MESKIEEAGSENSLVIDLEEQADPKQLKADAKEKTKKQKEAAKAKKKAEKEAKANAKKAAKDAKANAKKETKANTKIDDTNSAKDTESTNVIVSISADVYDV